MGSASRAAASSATGRGPAVERGGMAGGCAREAVGWLNDAVKAVCRGWQTVSTRVEQGDGHPWLEASRGVPYGLIMASRAMP